MLGCILRQAHHSIRTWVVNLGIGLIGFGCFGLAGLDQPRAFGQIDAEQRAELADRILAAKEGLDAAKLPDLEAAQAEVLQQLEALDDYLRQHTDDENRAAWFRYLNIAPLQQAIKQADNATQQRQLAEQLQLRMSRNLAGLDLPAMRRLRRSLRRLESAARFRRRDRTIEILAGQLDKLAARMREMQDVPEAEDAASLSVVLDLLDEAGQDDAVLSILRGKFSQPNIRLMIGEPLINRIASRSINRTQPVNDCILGTRVIGNATLIGSVQANLVPSYDTVRIQLSMMGNFTARNTGYNGPVSLNTLSHGNVMARRTLLVSEQGIQLEPTYAEAQLNTNIQRVNHRLRLVRKIASRRAAEQKPRAEQISVRKLQQQVGGEFDRETSRFAGRSLELPMNDIEKTFGRLDVSVPTRQMYASDSFVYVDLRQAEPDQVLALTTPPGLSSDTYIGAQFHESAIDNVASQVLAGRTMNREQIESLLDGLRSPEDEEKPLPEPFVTPPPMEDDQPIDAEALESFEIEFAGFRPLIFEARDDTLRVGVRGRRFSQASRELDRSVEITAVYKPTYFEDKVYLLRQGDVDVAFPGRGRLSVTQVAIKRNIQIAFRNAFPPAILNRPIELPLEEVGGLTIYPRTITARDGWLSVGLK
ncbi:hypothetical protein [Roseimaritima ulvae]|uniref:Uncharacterized protein n=1 Tax=Roseimaritima ulvae TaxID=980254 RepID=A0A5B9QNT6_9BACT|nr:hypothetical protein [Roseimaritima ulvae]QEG40767.1 hypothetical protein UC8_27840 [Roseimaritima ulvae]